MAVIPRLFYVADEMLPSRPPCSFVDQPARKLRETFQQMELSQDSMSGPAAHSDAALKCCTELHGALVIVL